MRKHKYWVMGATAALVMVSSPAVAAELANGDGQSCGGEIGVWHFVNNQTDGAAPGTLTAKFSDGTTWTVTPTAVNQRVQHFHVESAGTLLSATTNLPGRLVLSDYSCEDVEKK